jgi:hypothetical protein
LVPAAKLIGELRSKITGMNREGAERNVSMQSDDLHHRILGNE